MNQAEGWHKKVQRVARPNEKSLKGASRQGCLVPTQHGGWLLPDRAIQEREQGGSRGAFHDLLPKGAAVTSASL